MAPVYKLHYFNITGRAEPIRWILSYGGVPFEDIRYERSDWPKVKPTTPLGQLPVLEIDGEKITQGFAICRYLANLVNLAGKNNDENFKIDIAVDMTTDLLKSAYEFKFEQDETKKKQLEEKLHGFIPIIFGALEEKAKQNGGFLAINRITWADIVFVTSYEDLRNLLEDKEILNNYPNLQKVKKNVLGNQNIKDWVQKRPKIPMFVYDLRNDL